MNQKLLCLVLAVFCSTVSLAFMDSLWVVGGEGVPGGLVPVEVWLEYEGAGGEDMLSAFDVPLTWEAALGTLELISLGPDFVAERWWHQSRIDNQGVLGAPHISKAGLSSFHMGMGVSRWFVERGSHLAATLDFRILRTAEPFDSACMDTLMKAFSPPIFLGFVDKAGINTCVPSFSTGCIEVVPCICGDCNGDRRITVADAIYISTYIYKGGDAPICEGDVNLDGRVTAGDAIYLLTYVYRDGLEPCNPP